MTSRSCATILLAAAFCWLVVIAIGVFFYLLFQ